MDIEKLIEHLRECGTYGFKQEFINRRSCQ